MPRDVLDDILRLGTRAPSGSNIQPWRVYVCQGETLARLKERMLAAYQSGESFGRQYRYYTEPLDEPYLTRRRACGWGLYEVVGIARGDRQASAAFRARNYDFFGAPVGMIFTIDERLELGSWIDYGIFLQTIMLAARGFGLHTCAQAAIGDFHPICRDEIGFSEAEKVVCGMALGYADQDAAVNRYQPRREPLERFASFLD